MNAHQLQDRLRSSPPPLLLHVLPEEIFAAQRIPGSLNACVYETAFLENVAAIAAGKDQEFIVYGAGENSQDSESAVDQLAASGYTRVSEFPGGLAEWKAAGFPLEGDRNLPVATPLDGVYRIDTKESLLRWTGRNLFNHHSGTIRAASGEIAVVNGLPASGCCLIDMNSIACEDIADPYWNDMLIRHLKSPDFFDVENHPTAAFEIAGGLTLPATAGSPNSLLECRLSIRGVTQPLQVLAVVACSSPDRITGQSQFEVDRTLFGSEYGSGRFFKFLGKHVVNDLFHLHVKLHGDRVDG